MTFNPNMDDATRKGLQSLLSINIDSYKGWDHAAEHTKDLQLQGFFLEMSDSRKRNADELRSLVYNAGEEPTESGSISGQLHRWWIDAKQALVGGDAQSALNEAERGEDAIKNTYEKAISDIHDARALDVVQRQFQSVRASHDRVKALRDRYKNPRG